MRTDLRKAFTKLRKAGFFARQNFWCCQTCGIHAIPEGTTDYVFYHSQDREMLRRDGKCYLSWGGDGHRIVEVLGSLGIKTEWDGNKSQRILMHAEL